MQLSALKTNPSPAQLWGINFIPNPKAIFKDDTDRAEFIERIASVLADSSTACFAWALMTNHVHILIRTADTPLATLMRRLLTGYAMAFNHRHRRHGQLFQNRYKLFPARRTPTCLN